MHTAALNKTQINQETTTTQNKQKHRKQDHTTENNIRTST